MVGQWKMVDVLLLKSMARTAYEMVLTTNRVDAMNHYGVAREASAILMGSS